MHAKMWLVVFHQHLRVVITSANLSREDWTLLGQVLFSTRVNNLKTIWCQDFPKLKPEEKDFHLHDPFGKSLREFVSSLTIPSEFLEHYDFSSAKVELIASAAGLHSGDK